MQENMEDNIDEAEETLSLCDLATHNDADAVEWEDSLRGSHSSSSISSPDEQDLFEFFSEDWSTNSIPYPPENIIFCGKRIAYKQQPISETIEKLESNQTSHKSRGLFRWNSDSFPKAKNPQRNGHKKHRREYSSLNRNEQRLHDLSSTSKQTYNQTHNPKKYGNSYDLSVHKMSILTSPSKSRWYLFLFGMPRVPTGMELRSIKSRQSRQSPSSSPLFQLKDGDQEVNACRKRSKGLWGLIRALGCVRHHQATTIKASIRAFHKS